MTEQRLREVRHSHGMKKIFCNRRTNIISRDLYDPSGERKRPLCRKWCAMTKPKIMKTTSEESARESFASGRGFEGRDFHGETERWATSACAGHAPACRTGKSTFMHEMTGRMRYDIVRRGIAIHST